MADIAYASELQHILDEGAVFAKELHNELIAEGFPADFVTDKIVDGAMACAFDHICYRVPTEERYTDCKRIFSEAAHLGVSCLKETLIGGRKIAVYKLPMPFIAKGSSTGYQPAFQIIELPAPKEGSPYPEGWEHGEIPLVNTPYRGSFDAFMGAFPQLKDRWNFSGYGKSSNNDIALKLKSGKTVKFHERALEDVIISERDN